MFHKEDYPVLSRYNIDNLFELSLLKANLELTEIFQYENSGKVITREKIDTVTEVFHPGIIIGKDKYGRIWVAHNHFSNKRPTFDLFDNFNNSRKPLWDKRKVRFSPEEIVQRAIAEVLKGKKYTWVNYNCQIFVNLIVRDEHTSEAVDKIADAAMVVAVVTSILGLIFESKPLTILGLSTLGIVGGTKGYSRIRR